MIDRIDKFIAECRMANIDDKISYIEYEVEDYIVITLFYIDVAVHKIFYEDIK